MDEAERSEVDPAAIGTTTPTEAEDPAAPAQPSWVRTAFLRAGVASALGGLACLGLGVAALLFPCASWVGDWLQRRRWRRSPARPTQRRAQAWATVGVALLLGPLAGAGVGAWKQHQDAVIEQLRELEDDARQWTVFGLVGAEPLIDWCQQIERVGLRGRRARRLHAEWAPLAHWMRGRSPSPPDAVGRTTVEELFLERSAYRGALGDGEAPSSTARLRCASAPATRAMRPAPGCSESSTPRALSPTTARPSRRPGRTSWAGSTPTRQTSGYEPCSFASKATSTRPSLTAKPDWSSPPAS